MTSVQTLPSSLMQSLAIKAIAQQFKSDDWLVLSDANLIAALDGTEPLSAVEWAGVLDSPLTLRRIQNLANQLAREARGKSASNTAASTSPSAANDSYWHHSQGLLLAAATDEPAPTLTTSDGLWSLIFLNATSASQPPALAQPHPSWQVVLKLNLTDAVGLTIVAKAPEVAVLDGSGATLLIGTLDEDGELVRPWPATITDTPFAHFKACGGVFSVELV